MLDNYKPEGYTVKELIALLSKVDCQNYKVRVYGDFEEGFRNGRVVDFDPKYDINHERKEIDLEVEV